MNYFRFACPYCGIPMEVPEADAEHPIQCPKCHGEEIIPAYNVTEDLSPSAHYVRVTPDRPGAAKSNSDPKKKTQRIGTAAAVDGSTPSSPATPPKPATAQSASGATALVARRPATRWSKEEQKAAELTPEIKLEILDGVRKRIADPNHWIRGIRGPHRYTYAAIQEGEELVPVSVDDDRATHFSLMGAIVADLHHRRIAQTAPGRAYFLDHEIIDAAKRTYLQGVSQSDRTDAERETEEHDPLDLNHEQCVAVLDDLKHIYLQKLRSDAQKEATTDVAHLSLKELAKRSEHGSIVTSEEIARAAYSEIENLKRRLLELERETYAKD